ncbi:GDSL esterase/lipase 1-like isoform X2 [Mercurialis annua]|uniref:GDSL esterase/lipase 1-like isoform X2 n=1 Tax=Mercurialis annua TaxID=3986 RepID=UPI0024AE45A8|nr:GDSL esterase/lipase 1-like isoform X2 [Mercurialis annua]
MSCVFSLLIFYSCLLVSNSATIKQNATPLFIFGDSYFDAGNNNYLNTDVNKANFFPYGETFFKHPTGRYSDGRIIPDFIAGYLNLPLILPYLQPGNQEYTNGVNFASGGAGALVQTFQGYVIDLTTQLGYFKNVKKKLRKKLGHRVTEALLSKAIYLFNIGVNDYAAPPQTNSTILHHYTNQQYVQIVIGNLTTVVKEIYKNGGRRFGFSTLVDLGSLPVSRAFEQTNNTPIGFKEVPIQIQLHNKALPNILKDLKKELGGFKYSIFDLYTSTSERINSPFKYDGKSACCGSGPFRGIGCGLVEDYELCENPNDFLFFDGSHPTEHFSNEMSKLMWSGNSKYTSPYNLKTLLET